MATVSNVTAGKPKIGGAVFRAATTATLPTAADTSLSGFTGLGYCSDAGLVNSNSAETTEIKAWGGDVVLDSQTGKPDSFQFTLIEALNPDVLQTIYGTTKVSGSIGTGITVDVTTNEAEEFAWVIDMVMRGGVLKRIVIPRGKITEVGDINYVDEDIVGYPVTVKAYPDANGTTHKEYIKKSGTS